MPSFQMLFIVAGVLVTLGIFVSVVALVPRPVRLRDAIDRLDGGATGVDTVVVDPFAGTLENLGAWSYRKLRLPLSDRTRQLLAMQERSIADLFAERLVWVVTALALPSVYALVSWSLGQPAGSLGIGFAAVAAVIGYFIPDIRLRRAASTMRAGATEAIFTFFDLVILERLANRSVTQSLHSAAGVSDALAFRRVRVALERARLEQEPPWRELRRLSTDLDLKVVADLADVLKLEEQGAALAEPLRARVRELRDAHLTTAKQEAQALTERMTLWMTLPALIFGLIFLVPPLLRLFGSGT